MLDTNVLASGLANLLSDRSTPGKILRSWNDGTFTLIISAPLLAELERTLGAYQGIPILTPREFLALLTEVENLPPQ